MCRKVGNRLYRTTGCSEKFATAFTESQAKRLKILMAARAGTKVFQSEL
jgi:hypothetical protein